MTPSGTRSLSSGLLRYWLALAFCAGSLVAPGADRKEFLSRLIKLNDEYIPVALGRQSTDANSAYHGAVFDTDSIVSPIATAHLVQTLVCGYISRESKYFQSEAILERMTLALRALLSLQHEDGTIDLLSTNFHSTPDLGFTIYPLASAYHIMLKNQRLRLGEVPALVKQYLLLAGKALAVGGIHTPNHRWIVCGALAWLHTFFPDPSYRARVEQWLAEKIDIDADGQYHERSTAVYTPHTNRSLLEVAKRMKYDYLFDVVRKNLDLTMYFVHANGEIATESSFRQDRYQRSNMGSYYLAYSYMALRDQDSRYAGMVSYIEKNVPFDQLRYMLPYFLEDPSWLKALPEATPIATSYHRHFKHSDVVRIREGEMDMSILTNNPTIFTYFKGEAVLEGMRLSTAFFGKGQFEARELEKENDTYILTATFEGPYYQPLPKEKIPADSDAWSVVPRNDRDTSEVQKLRVRLYITPADGRATIKVSVEGPKNLPVTLEFGFRKGGTLYEVSPKAGADQAFLVNAGEYAIYQKGGNQIKVGPGVRGHQWTQLRGALPKLDADCVYFTHFAPCEFEFTIE